MRCSCGLVVEDGGKAISTRRVSIKIDLYETAFGVRTELRRGHRITHSDLVKMRVPASTLPSDAVTRPEFATGAEVRRRIRTGEVLRQAWFKIPPVITRGDRVRIVARRGAVRLTTVGQALNNATQSAFVRVRNLQSKKVITGRATGPGVVEMEF